MKKIILSLFILFIAANIACAKAIKFKTIKYIDKQGAGIECFRMLIPSTWKFTGGIKWVMDNPAMPAVISFKAYNPSDAEEMKVFPSEPYFWTNDQTMLMNFPKGSKYMGSVVHPPMSAINFIKKMLLPKYWYKVSNLKVVSAMELPELAKALGQKAQSKPGLNAYSDAGKVKINYSKNGVPIEEEIFVVINRADFSMNGMYGVVTHNNWVCDYIISFKAKKGQLSSNKKIFDTIVYSFKFNPKWFNKYAQFVNYLVQNQIKQINNIGEVSKIISRTNDEISSGIMESYNQRSKAYDHISNNFSQHIRGVDEYSDPNKNNPVELPAGYSHAWSNPLGEYVVSDDPNYNPNVGSNRSWTEMEKNK